MKRLLIYLAVISITFSAVAQSPQKMSYQCVIRNSGGTLVANQGVGIKISILQGSPTGTLIYQEIYNPNPLTNANGLVAVEIGGGIPVTGSFGAIDWSAGTYFIKTETDPTGGTNYTITGTSQLLSVPYAFYANSAAKHSIGESYGGGIVFYVYDNGQHGLIASTADQSTGIGMRWDAGTGTNTMAFADGVGAGKANTAIIIANQRDGDFATYAARLCNEYSVTVGGVTYGDWYLPSKFELNLLYLQKSVVGSFATNYYWSSTEESINDTWSQIFGTGLQVFGRKGGEANVRAIRGF